MFSYVTSKILYSYKEVREAEKYLKRADDLFRKTSR